MILLSGHSLTADRVVPAEEMSTQLNERDSTAVLIPADMSGISLNSWLKDDKAPGAGIVWRVRNIQQAFDARTTQLQMEHVIGTLKDNVLFGERKPADISGTAGATTCTARQAVVYILSNQSDWTLGSFDYDEVSNPYRFDGETLFEALEKVTDSLEDAWWSFDLTVYPFRLNITRRSTTVRSELRAGRNLSTITKTIDRGGMYTRFYPIGKDDLHIDSQYVERNTATYGVISKVETDTSIDSKEELIRWANERLAKHAEPTVTIDVEGLELATATGESLDSLQLGAVCRIPLPEFSTTIQEKIVSLSYPDKLRQPERVVIQLANSRTDVARIIAEMIRKSGGGGRSAARQAQEDHAWFEDTDTRVAMVAEGIIGTDPETGEPYWDRLSEFIADGEGLHAIVSDGLDGLTTRIASIEINENEIRSSVAASESQIYTVISQTATGIRTDLVSAESGLYAYVDQTASYFRQHYGSSAVNWVQDTDPTLGGAEPKEGDFWIESTFNGTWDGAEGFNWEHEEGYDWTQLQGAKIWTWANDKWELVSDQQQVVTAADVVETSEFILNRAIKVMTNDDGNLSVYRALLYTEGDRIRSEINELISDVGSSIEQTASAIRSEVHAANSQIYSYILQTASQITIRVGESNMVFTGKTKPSGTTDHPLVDGDLWLDSTFKRTWADLEAVDEWIDDEDYDWSDLKGSTLYVYDSELGDFKEALDETALASDTDIEEEKDHISLIARQVKQVDGKVDTFRAEVKVQSDKVTSTLNQRIADLGSNITQTASQIRSEVHAAKSSLYSSIEQTASYIRAEVVDTANGLSSQITQTASQIRSEVSSAKSTIWSSITQNSDSIELKVSKNGVISAINQTAESIRIQAGKINLDGYVTTSMMESAFQSVQQLSTQQLTVSSYFTCLGYNAEWKSFTHHNFSVSGNNYFVYRSGGSDYTVSGYIMRSHSTTTIYYLGR